MTSDIRVEDLANVDVTQAANGSVLSYETARAIWKANNQASVATQGYVDAAIEAALATLRVQ